MHPRRRRRRRACCGRAATYLVFDVHVGGTEQPDELWYDVGLNDGLGLVRGPRGDVCEGPGRLKLQFRVRVQRKHRRQLWHHARIDHLLDGRVALDGQELAQSPHALQSLGRLT